MRVTLGVDYGDTHAASALVQRLRFHNATIDFTHVIPDSIWAPPAGVGMISAEALMSNDDAQEVTRQENQDAKRILAAASTGFPEAETEFVTSLLRGNPTQTLLEHADHTHSDLIAVNASRETPLFALLTGSVARGLVIGARQSVLLARNPVSAGGKEVADRPLRAVLATDHSEYMERCIEKLTHFAPHGLSHLTVLTAFPDSNVKSLQSRLPNLAVDPGEAMRHELQSRNEALVERLQASFAHTSTTTTVSSQLCTDSIDQAILLEMQETDADLLIVGAQGHSLIERLTIGSVSFRQAMTAPYSVLILRLDTAEIQAIRGSD